MATEPKVTCDQCGEEFELDEENEDYCPNCFARYDADDHDNLDDSMDGDAESALASAGLGTDEDYGDFGGGDDL